MGRPGRSTGPVPHGDPPTDADASAGPSRTGHPSPSLPSRAGEAADGGSDRESGPVDASSAWDELRQAVGGEEVVAVDESLAGGDDADPELIAEAEAIADDAYAEARASEGVEEAEQQVLDDLAKLVAERDDYLDQLLRITADFDNYRKRMLKQQTEHVERAAESLVEKLLSVLDVFDAALAHGEGFDQVQTSLIGVLEKEGLEKIDPSGRPFDPNEADAVAHEAADDGPLVAEVFRAGYRWKGRVLRPAMVKVRG